MTLREIKAALRSGPYTWPGGYPIYFITTQGDALSFKAVYTGWRNVCEAHLVEGCDCNGWDVSAIDINWENAELRCAETNELIESAYGGDAI